MGSARGTFSINYDAESIRSVNSTDYSVDPEVKQREAVKEQLLLQDVGEPNIIHVHVHVAINVHLHVHLHVYKPLI